MKLSMCTPLSQLTFIMTRKVERFHQIYTNILSINSFLYFTSTKINPNITNCWAKDQTKQILQNLGIFLWGRKDQDIRIFDIGYMYFSTLL